MATPTTYSVRVSSETHKVEEWLTSDEALAWQLQEEENTRVAAADTREFAGNVSLEPSSPAVEYRPEQNAAQVCCFGTLPFELFWFIGIGALHMERNSICLN
jgi:E3 ubiquitin-protein ligase BIG BROTHER-like protein